MESAVDWTPVDLLVSQLMDVYEPHEDVETIQETFSKLNEKREEFRSEEESLRNILKGKLRILSLIQRFAKRGRGLRGC